MDGREGTEVISVFDWQEEKGAPLVSLIATDINERTDRRSRQNSVADVMWACEGCPGMRTTLCTTFVMVTVVVISRRCATRLSGYVTLSVLRTTCVSIRSVEETWPVVYQELKLTGHGYWTQKLADTLPWKHIKTMFLVWMQEMRSFQILSLKFSQKQTHFFM